MQFFLDTANIQEIETGLEWGLVDGITTNPTLIAKQGKPYLATVQAIARLVPGPVSGEVLATELDEILEQGRRLAGLAENVVVKVPLTPPGLRAVGALREEGIRTNVTLCFSAAQALLAAKAGAAYISPFVGRLDDVGEDGMELIEKIVSIYENYEFDTEVLVASVRHPMHVVQSALLGADVATMPFKILEQLYKHPLTDVGLDALPRRLEEDRQDLRGIARGRSLGAAVSLTIPAAARAALPPGLGPVHGHGAGRHPLDRPAAWRDPAPPLPRSAAVVARPAAGARRGRAAPRHLEGGGGVPPSGARRFEEQLLALLGPLARAEVVALALLSGFAEELFFRGAVQGAVGPGFPRACSSRRFTPAPSARFRLWTVFAATGRAPFAGGSLLSPVTFWRR